MYMSIKVSVIIPVYNVEQYLRQCLDSVVNQTFSEIEIICINDFSTDNSLLILKEYKQKDNRIVIVNLSENKGQGNARNEGLKFAKGKYVTFVDSDDWISKDNIATLYTEIENNNLDMVSANSYIYDNLTKKVLEKKVTSADILNRQKIEKLLIVKKDNFVIPVWTKIYRRKFLEDNNIKFKLNWHEDNLFVFEILIKTTKIKFIDNKIYFYRVNRQNSSMFEINKDFTYFLLFEKLKEMLRESDKYEIYKVVYYQYISIATASKLEVLNLDLLKLKCYFYKFKQLYYNKEFIDNFSVKNLTVAHKIRISLFYLCLKFNINYAIIGKFCRKINLANFIRK